MEINKLDEILKNHKLWLNNEGGACADLSGVDLSNANLSGIGLSNANLRFVNLSGADLNGADLYEANLSNTNLRNADLSGVNLYGANSRGVDLRGANLTKANLRGANLTKANLRGANLTNVRTNIYTIGYNLVCPEEGSFIAYKKAKDCIIKLLILENSKRSSSTSIKCRCDKAKVLDIENIETGEKVESVPSNYNVNFVYRVGEIVKVDNFDEDRWNECSIGIHFFMNKQNAIKY
jgi:hypothetical protein